MGAMVVVALFWVLAVNGGPLVYFDTLSYADQGHKVLDTVYNKLGGSLGASSGANMAGGDIEGALRDGSAVAPGTAPDNTIDLTRSVLFSVLIDGSLRLGLPIGLPILAALLIVLLSWQLSGQFSNTGVPRPWLLGLPIIAAGFASLPFYVAYLMPDIFTPLLILSASLLTVFGRELTVGQLLVGFLILIVSVILHPSNLLIAAALVPIAAVAGRVANRARWWIGAVALILAVLVGAAERKTIKLFASSMGESQAIYLPLLTARLIADGPGYTYLAETCPDRTEPSCALFDQLQLSSNPMRLTASHIVFARDAELGSFRHLDPSVQKSIGGSQTEFLLRVVLAHPLDVAMALLRNTLVQAKLTSVDMTIADPGLVAKAADKGLTGNVSRLVQDRGWLAPLNAFHASVYIVSLAAIATALVWPGALLRPERVLAGFVVLAILVNAFVCGGVSQPATRYGARVAWLLPYLAMLLVLIAHGRRRKPEVNYDA